MKKRMMEDNMGVLQLPLSTCGDASYAMLPHRAPYDTMHVYYLLIKRAYLNQVV